MPIIAQSNGWTISSNLGRSVAGDDKPAMLSFWIEQDALRSKTIFVEVVPLAGHVADSDEAVSWSQDEQAEPPALAKILTMGSDGRFLLQLSARDFDELNEVFEIKIYESSVQACWGHAPLIESTFSMLEKAIDAKTSADHFDFGTMPEYDVIIDFQQALSRVLLSSPVPLEAHNSLSKPDAAAVVDVSSDRDELQGGDLAGINQDDFIFG